MRFNCGFPHSLQVNVVIISPLSHNNLLIILLLAMSISNQLDNSKTESSTTVFVRGCQSTHLYTTSVMSVAVFSQSRFRYCKRSVLRRIFGACVTEFSVFIRVSRLGYPHPFLSVTSLGTKTLFSNGLKMFCLKPIWTYGIQLWARLPHPTSRSWNASNRKPCA
jgi:hypothetical protein